MRPTNPTFNAAKSSSFIKSIPVELYPLFAACGMACVSAIYFSSKKLRTDKTLKLGREVPKFDDKLEEVISKQE
ncbi:putative membrane protein [Ogataea parapolymorpha DL-1]|uniref:Membrane protein n=1 Tax=Ogataea parapolymorpha (strain ATCC 26012 / BCRC 20466 / JCM 22074 / NRRL Y-7560 / DL-1) TaxID=871575 RepID=W1QD46_OGAPD|nr:putative membrane protein [Ogataea parapolymorpha DL-1]ESW97612.1 putative membrane protein [Ogataea parapolymorpha DL-1]